MAEDVGGNGHVNIDLSNVPKGYEKFISFLDDMNLINQSFQTQEVASGIKILAVPGDDVTELPMRADFPDRRFLVACARHLAKCRKFDDKEGEKELLFIVAGFCGIQGKRADMLVTAIIGERKQNYLKNAGTFGQKFRKAAGLGESNQSE